MSGSVAASGLAMPAILEAAERLRGVARRTPVQTSAQLDEMTGARVFLKCENFQRTGSFKFRGGYNAMSLLSEEERRRGVITYSSGNHAQALSLAGRLLGAPVTIVMPNDADPSKMAATRAYGGTLVLYDPATEDREEIGSRLAAERGLSMIPPYNHTGVMAGQGTATVELFEEVPDLDLLLIACGGGGLISGSSVAAKALKPGCRVIGVEPAEADDATRSFRAGAIQRVHNPRTVADGVRTPALGELTFPVILKNVDDMATVSEAGIVRAMHFLWERMKLVVEPTGAVPLAALMEERVNARGLRIGLVLCGGNVDFQRAAGLFREFGLAD